MIPILDQELHPSEMLRKFGCLFYLPYWYFVFGYLSMVSGATMYFMAMDIGVTHTGGCLVFCTCLSILPTFYVLAYVHRASRSAQRVDASFELLES